MRKIWFGAVACMLLAVLTIVASASARSDASGKREKEQSKGEGHHLWTSLSKQH